MSANAKRIREPVKVVKLVQTCRACPSQWNAWLSDGRMIYVRYRWGTLSITISDRPTEDVNLLFEHGEDLFVGQIGDSLDGTLSTEDMVPYLWKALEF